jgi:GNAT superfamily N-acetyltransferase
MPRNQVHSRNQVSQFELFCTHLLMVGLASRVRLSKDRLRAQCLPQGAACSYARVTIDDRLAGNIFACRWNYDDRIVCWVTQLVVHHDFRERGIAFSLLNQIRQDNDEVCGVMSSHPAACLAAAKAFGSKCMLYSYTMNQY